MPAPRLGQLPANNHSGLDKIAKALDLIGGIQSIGDHADLVARNKAEQDAKMQALLDARQKFKDQQALEAAQKDPASAQSVAARAAYAAYKLPGMADTMSAADLEKSFGPLSAYAQKQFAGDIEKRNKIAEMFAKGSAEKIADKRLPPNQVLSLNEGAQIPRALEDIRTTLDANKDIFGPVAGRLAGANPYNEKAATIDAQFRTAAQQFGRYMEGGVLRKEDEEKYRKMFPQLSDTPAVAANKLALVDRMLKQKSESDQAAIAASGYDTRGLKSAGLAPPLPGILKGAPQGAGGLVPEAKAGAGQINDADREALVWLKANPKDPHAADVAKQLRRKGLL